MVRERPSWQYALIGIIGLLILVLVVLGAGPSTGAAPMPARPELVLQLGHSAPIAALAFSPDGQTIASGGVDGVVKLWKTATGDLHRTLSGHTDALDSAAFSPDGRWLATGGTDKTVRLWDVASGKQRRVLTGHTDFVVRVVFSPNGKTLASASNDNSIRLWDVSTGKLLQHIVVRLNYSAIGFSLDGNTLISQSVNGIMFWDTKTGRLQSSYFVKDDMQSASFSPDMGTLASTDLDYNVRIRSLATGKIQRVIKEEDGVIETTFSPDGKTLACNFINIDKIKLWDVTTGKLRQTLTGRNNSMSVIAFHPDGKMIASGGLDQILCLWDNETGKLQRAFAGRGSPVHSAAFVPGQNIVAAGCDDGTLRLWDLNTGTIRRKLVGSKDRIHSIAIDRTGSRLACAGWDKSIKVWDLASGNLQKTFAGHGDHIWEVAFSPDGNLLASASADNTVRLWDLNTGKLRQVLPGRLDFLSVAFSPDGKELAGGSQDKQVWLWETATGKVRTLLKGHSDIISCIAFSPNGETLASGSGDDTICLWNPATGKLRSTLTCRGHLVKSISFNSDSGILASSGADQTVRLWDARLGQLRRILSGHTDMANCIAFSSDDGTLASGSDDGTLKLWKAGASWQAVSLLALPSETEGGPDTVLQVLDEGYYSGSPGVDRTIRWRVGSDLFPADAYERTFNRPDLIRKALAGEAIPPAPEAQRFTMGQAIPPQVTIRTPRPGEELAGPAVNIEVVATDDRSVERIELLINGRLVGAKPIPAFAKPIPALAKPIPAWAKPIPASHTISREFQAFVPLPPGETVLTLKAIAYDDENLQSWEEVHLTRKASPVPGDLYVLAVGVSRYSNRDPKYQLKYAAADANAFADLWPRAEGKLFRKVHVTRILDEQATAVGIKEALVRITTQATERDTVGLFLSGHGLSVEDRDFYFASTEVDVNRPAETALPWTVLQSILAKMDARRVFLFLDACHSGNALGGQRANTERMAELLVKRAGVLVFASSRGSEYSYELDELRHGAFTQAIVEGLGEGKADLDLGAGKDGVVDVDELQAFLRRRVQQLTGNLQTPTCPLIRDFGDPFPLFRTR